MYDTYQRRITECDEQLQKHLASFSKTILSSPPEAEPKRKRSKPAKNAPQFELRSELQRITGVDLTRIDGIDVMVAQTLVSEIGLDMSRWKTEAHFASWLGLCPDNRTSGDKILNCGTRHVINRAANSTVPGSTRSGTKEAVGRYSGGRSSTRRLVAPGLRVARFGPGIVILILHR